MELTLFSSDKNFRFTPRTCKRNRKRNRVWRFLCVVKILETGQSCGFIVFPTSFFWSFSPPFFFNVAFLPHATVSSINHHNLIFIASILKFCPQTALDLLYTATPFKASKSSFNPLDAPGYVSVSALSVTPAKVTLSSTTSTPPPLVLSTQSSLSWLRQL